MGRAHLGHHCWLRVLIRRRDLDHDLPAGMRLEEKPSQNYAISLPSRGLAATRPRRARKARGYISRPSTRMQEPQRGRSSLIMAVLCEDADEMRSLSTRTAGTCRPNIWGTKRSQPCDVAGCAITLTWMGRARPHPGNWLVLYAVLLVTSLAWCFVLVVTLRAGVGGGMGVPRRGNRKQFKWEKRTKDLISTKATQTF